MRATILVVWVSAMLLHSAGVGHAQDSQTAAEIVASGIEISPADCGGGGAAWRDWVVIPATTASSGSAIEHTRATTTEAAEALAICRSAGLKNGDLSLRFRAISGASRQSGGLALRMATPKDYYLVKVDALRNRALLLQVSNGLEEEIVGDDADVAGDVWHTGSGSSGDTIRLSRMRAGSLYGLNRAASSGLIASRSDPLRNLYRGGDDPSWLPKVVRTPCALLTSARSPLNKSMGHVHQRDIQINLHRIDSPSPSVFDYGINAVEG